MSNFTLQCNLLQSLFTWLYIVLQNMWQGFHLHNKSIMWGTAHLHRSVCYRWLVFCCICILNAWLLNSKAAAVLHGCKTPSCLLLPAAAADWCSPMLPRWAAVGAFLVSIDTDSWPDITKPPSNIILRIAGLNNRSGLVAWKMVHM